MNPTSGVSTITFFVPKLPVGEYPLYVTNKIGTTQYGIKLRRRLNAQRPQPEGEHRAY